MLRTDMNKHDQENVTQELLNVLYYLEHYRVALQDVCKEDHTFVLANKYWLHTAIPQNYQGRLNCFIDLRSLFKCAQLRILRLH